MFPILWLLLKDTSQASPRTPHERPKQAPPRWLWGTLQGPCI